MRDNNYIVKGKVVLKWSAPHELLLSSESGVLF